MAAAVVVEREVECKSTVADLWRVLTDTSYLNRLSGEAPRQIAEIAASDGARYRIKTKAGGFSVEWEEWPFEWEHQQRFRVFRRFKAGPVDSVDTVLTFSTREDGSARVGVRLALVPKIAWLAWMVRFGTRRAADALVLSVRAVDEALSRRAPLPPATIKPPEADGGLERARRALSEKAASPELVDKLCDWIRMARDEDLARIRPYALADDWGVDRRTMLATCLQGVRAGLLELRWEVICPSCRVGAEVVNTLAAVKEHAQCHLCEIAFGLDVDEALEATFAPTLAVRKIDVGQYCVGGPARTPHVLQQARLPTRGSATLIAPREPGRYRLFVRGGEAIPLEVTADGTAAVNVRSDAHDAVHVGAGGTVTLESAHDDERHVKLERVLHESQAATAREVSLLPGFRRDFSAEVLRPDLALKISTVTLFFSDLTASTQLYADIGDAAALRLVHDHFDIVLGIVERHGGALVKTIGDAVMAAFADDLAAVAASLEMLRAFDKFRREAPNGDRTHLKLGLFRGPSFLVNANGVLDYFGQTVNIAARLQAQASSGELVIEGTLADLAIQSGKLEAGVVKQRYRATLKGVTDAIDVARIVAVE